MKKTTINLLLIPMLLSLGAQSSFARLSHASSKLFGDKKAVYTEVRTKVDSAKRLHDPVDFVSVEDNLFRTTTVQFTTTVCRGSETSPNVAIQLVLSAVSATVTTVAYSVSGTATGGGVDYTLANGSITIPAGQTTATINAVIINDTVEEISETMVVTLTSATNATLGTNTIFTYTITNNSIIGYTGPGGVGQASTMPLWLKAKDLEGLADGANVQSWPDFSGNGNTLTQPDAGLSPIYKTGIANGFPVVRFNKAANRLRKTDFLNFPSTTITTIMAHKIEDATPGTYLSFASSNSNDDFRLSDDNIQFTIANSTPVATLTSYSDDKFNVNVSSWRSSSGEVSFRKNLAGGVLNFVVNDVKNRSISPIGSLALGARQGDIDASYVSGSFHDGDLAEVIIFNRYLNRSQNIIIGNYLSAKYNILLEGDNAYDEDENGNFDYDVAGIGRVSASDFHLDAQGTGIVRVNNPQDLGNNEFFHWGHNNMAMDLTSTNVSMGVSIRLARTWRVSERNRSSMTTFVDVGAVDMSFDLTGLSSVNAQNLVLLVDSDGDFSSGVTAIAGAIDDGNNVYRFAGVTAITNNAYFTIGIRPTVQFAISAAAGSETNPDVAIQLQMNDPLTTEASVTYSLSGTATGGGIDYTLANGTVTIPAGETTATINAVIINDAVDEISETMIVTLVSATNVNLGVKTSFTYTITNNSIIGYTGPGGVGQSSTMVLWLRAHDLDGLTDGANVQSWPDSSGNGNTLTQPILGLRPTYKESIADINGYPAIQFNALAQTRLVRNPFTDFPTSAITTVSVNKISDNDPGTFLSYASSGHNEDYVLKDDKLTQVIASNPITTGWDRDNVLYEIIQSAWRSSDGSLRFTINNYGAIVLQVPAQKNLLITTGGSLALGATQGGLDSNYVTDSYFDNNFAEVIIFNVFLNRAQNTIVDNYLSAKYGIILANGGLFKQRSQGNYGNDVAGIGQVGVNNAHLDARGTGIVRVNNPQDLGNDEFLLWGHDGKELVEVNDLDVPQGTSRRLDRKWIVAESDASSSPLNVDVGAIDISFDLTGLGNVNVDELVLLIDADGVFLSGATVIEGAIDDGNNIYRFEGLTAIQDYSYFTLGTKSSEDTPLPIDLVEFRGRIANDFQIELDWCTASEVNNSHFTIERSGNGFDFEPIVTIQSKGESDQLTDYNYTDDHPLIGRNYYRLRQHDFSGAYDYSEIVSLYVEQSNKENRYLLYPNPAVLGEFVTLQTDSAEPHVIEIQVVNNMGAVLYQKTFSIVSGKDEVYLDTNSLNTGINFLKIIDESNTITFFKIFMK